MRRPNGQASTKTRLRCVIYTRKSTEEGLQQDFNSLDAQREAAEAFIQSQAAEGWVCLPDRYDDGGYTGANMERPALQRLMHDIETGRVDCVVVYKVDRLSRSLLDFARMMERFEKHKISFVSVTQQFNTTHSMGRLTLNILLSFAQFEREIISERTRDKIAASRRKGKWGGGHPVLGYDIVRAPGGSKLVVNGEEAERVRQIFDLYVEKQSLIQTSAELNARGWTSKHWTTSSGQERGGERFDKAILYRTLTNIIYLGKVRYKDEIHPGEHKALIDESVFQRVQSMLQLNGRTGGMHIRNKYGALLKGLLYCKPCGHAMSHSYTTKENKAYRYYVCGRAQKQGWIECPSRSIPAEEIERFVVDHIKAIGKDPATMSMVLEQARGQADEEIASLERDLITADREISQIHSELAKVAPDAASNGYAATRLADLHERLRGLEQHRTELRERIEHLKRTQVSKAEVDSALETFTPLWNSLSPKEQARVLQLLVRRVDYDGGKGKVAITFHPNGLRSLGESNSDMEEKGCTAA